MTLEKKNTKAECSCITIERNRLAKWVLSDFAKWHASSNSKLHLAPYFRSLYTTTFPSRLRRLRKYRINIHYVRKRMRKRIFEQLVNRFQSLSVPPNQTVWKNVSCDLTREKKKKKQMSLSSVYFSSVCVFVPRFEASWLGNKTRINIVPTGLSIQLWNNYARKSIDDEVLHTRLMTKHLNNKDLFLEN
jgi:hypothetical protein